MICRKGAEGTLPLPVEDKIEILTWLGSAAEADLREKALETLHGLDRAEVRGVMANPETPPEVLRFVAEQLLAGDDVLRETLRWNPAFPAESLDLLQPKPAPKR